MSKGGVELSFEKLKNGTCDVFADIFPLCSDGPFLTADQIKFIKVEPFEQGSHRLFNIPYEDLKEFAESILKEKSSDPQETPKI